MILLGSGTVFLTATDSWGAVRKPLSEVQAWFQKDHPGEEEDQTQETLSQEVSPGDMISGGNIPKPQEPVSGNNTSVSEGSSGEETVNTGEVQESPVASRSPEEVTYTAVEDDYFSDAVFIGDSRTVGMFEYGGLENITTFYASTGLTVFKLFDSPIVTVPGQNDKITVEQALSERQFSKIYLMIGINEMGRGTVETFMEKYKEVLAHLQELQPDAIIYLQGIMRVTTERSNKGDYINNPGIDARNAEIAKLADYVKVYYLDVNPLICDETGGMETTYTFDGVHLKAQYIPIWKDFLKQHAVVLD